MSFKENIANSLTIFRILIVPFFIFSVLGVTVLSGSVALILFLFASLSDYLDGYFARKYNIHSRFGEFLDPLADKLLVGAAFICFALIPDFNIPFILIVIVLTREVFITSLRIEFHRKIALSFSTLFLVLGSLPFALRVRQRRVGLSSLGLAFFVSFLYYVMFSLSSPLGKIDFFFPWIACWLPNIFFGVSGLIGLSSLS